MSDQESGDDGRVRLLTFSEGCGEQAAPGSLGIRRGAPCWRAASVSEAQLYAVWTIVTFRRCISVAQLLVYAGMAGVTTSAA